MTLIKRSIAWNLTVLLLFTIVGSCQSDREAEFQKQLVQAAEAINKDCPMRIDSQTRLDNTRAAPGKTFIYNYTLVNYRREELDSTAIRAEMTPALINNIRTSREMATFRQNQVTLIYKYKDREGENFLQIMISPQDYQD